MTKPPSGKGGYVGAISSVISCNQDSTPAAAQTIPPPPPSMLSRAGAR